MGKLFLPWGQLGVGAGCPEKLCHLHPERCFQDPSTEQLLGLTAVPALSRILGCRPGKVTSNIISPLSLSFSVLWWCINISVKRVYFCWCCQRGFPLQMDQAGYMVWGVRYRSAGLSNGVHNVLTPYNISYFPQLSAHTFTRLKTAGCMQEGWWSRTSGVALHILIGNFSCLLMAG